MAAEAKAADIPSLVQKTKPAVVEVVALNAQNEQIRSGTGFFISSDGNLLTANSLINGASSIVAKTPTGAAYSLKRIVFTSKNPDVAELNFSATNVAHLDLGSSADLVEGQHVLVISNPDSAQGTISEGLVSAFPENRSLAQITAPLSISSTGSPVIDEVGNVIGLAVQTKKEGQKISLAIAAESIKNLLANPPAKIASIPQQQAPSKTAATPQQKAAHPGYGLAYDDTPNIVRFMDDFGLSGKWASQAANLRAFFEELQERLADPSFMINEFNQAAKDRKSPADEVYRLCKSINQCHEEP